MGLFAIPDLERYAMLRPAPSRLTLRAQMRRRQFIILVGGAAALLPAEARAQERMRRIGILSGGAEGDAEGEGLVQAFLQAMQALGWQRGTNVQIDIRWGASNLDRMARFAKELVAMQPDLILAITTPAVAAILRETRDIPVVFTVVSDPVGSGFVPQNLSRPGGNVTGFINFEPSLGGKWVQVLKEIAAQISRVALLFNPDTAPYLTNYLGVLESGSRTLGVDAQAAPFHGAADIEATIMALGRGPEAGLIVMPDISNQKHRVSILRATRRPCLVRCGPPGPAPSRGDLCRPYSERRTAS
jgi:putative ABC transport system substrate-binding protein